MISHRRKVPLHDESLFGKDPFIGRKGVEGACSHSFFNNMKPSLIDIEVDWEFVSLQDLAPLAMNKMDAMSVEGLRIQSGMSEEEASSSISPQSPGKILAFEGKNVNPVGFSVWQVQNRTNLMPRMVTIVLMDYCLIQ